MWRAIVKLRFQRAICIHADLRRQSHGDIIVLNTGDSLNAMYRYTQHFGVLNKDFTIFKAPQFYGLK